MKVNLEMECTPWLNEDGTIEVGIWFGRDCELTLEESFLLKEMVDNTLESMKVGNKIADHHFDDVEKLLISLNDLYEHAKTTAEDLGYV
jgi:hypothetical protein